MMTTITSSQIATAAALGTVTLDGPEWLHITLDADRGAQVTTGWGEFMVYLSDAWTATGPAQRVVPTFDQALDIVRQFRDFS